MEVKRGESRSALQTDLGMFPSDWSVVPISDVCDLVVDCKNRTPPVIDGGEYAVVRTPNVRNGRFVRDDLRYTDENAFREWTKRAVPRSGDVLITREAPLGEVCLVPPDISVCLGQRMMLYRPNEDKASAGYLLYALMSTSVQRSLQAKVGGSTVGHAQVKDIRDLVIPIASTKREQQDIAEVLTDVDALIESLSLLLAKKCQIKQGTMQELLTGKTRLSGFSGEWKAKVLGQSASLKARIGWQGLTTKEYLERGDFYLVTGTEIRGGEINWDECSHVEAVRYKQDLNIQLQIDDVLVTKDGTIGKVGIVTELPKPATLNSGVFVIRPTGRGFHPRFFYYLLCSSVFSDFLAQLAAGSTINHLYQKDFVNFAFYLPPTEEEQKAIADTLTDMDADISAARIKLAKACQLKQGVMQELLTGRIRLISPTSNVIPSPVKASVAEAASTPRAHNWQINEAAVIGVLAQRFGTEKFPLPRKRRVKLMYLLHRHAEGRAEGYLKKAAGPYDPNTKYKGPEAIALKNDYVRALNNGKYEGFVAGDKAAQAFGYFEQWYGTAALEWLERFHYRKTDDLEFLATVDMAMMDLVTARQSCDVPGVRRVIAAHPEWVPKLSRELFSDEKIARAISECQSLFDN